jgi:hypothetical protein
MGDALDRGMTWYASPSEPPTEPEVCASRDLFQARLDGLLRELLRSGWVADQAALLVAVLGEVGNNSFDHNLGRWPDVPGCWFGREPERDPPRFAVLDRGVGILATLGRADPGLATAQQAVDASFSRVLSGRAPERRGNGLKFVRSVVNGSERRGLVCQSGGGRAWFGGLLGPLAAATARLDATAAPGVAVILAWSPGP